MSGVGIPLKVVEMAAYDPLDVDAGGTVDEDKEDPIAIVRGKRGNEDRSVGDGLNVAEGPVDHCRGEILDESVPTPVSSEHSSQPDDRGWKCSTSTTSSQNERKQSCSENGKKQRSTKPGHMRRNIRYDKFFLF
eukprot:g45085.t1